MKMFQNIKFNGFGDKLRLEEIWRPKHIVTIKGVAKNVLLPEQYRKLSKAIGIASEPQIAGLIALFTKSFQKMFQNITFSLGCWLNSGFGPAGPGALTHGTPAALAALGHKGPGTTVTSLSPSSAHIKQLATPRSGYVLLASNIY